MHFSAGEVYPGKPWDLHFIAVAKGSRSELNVSVLSGGYGSIRAEATFDSVPAAIARIVATGPKGRRCAIGLDL